MRLAWCRMAQTSACRAAPTSLSDRLDDTRTLINELAAHHDITALDRSNIHELVRLAFRQPFDLHIYELADADDEAFLWPYVMHYPGLVRLRTASLHHSRATALARQRREDDRRIELRFGRGDLSAPPVLASRVVVVADEHIAAALRREYPTARIRVAPLGLAPGNRPDVGRSSVGGALRVGVLGHAMRPTIERAVERVRHAGYDIEQMPDPSPDRVLRDAAVVLWMPWPPVDDLAPAVAALADARPLVTFETEATAAWPALDPQTWLPRGIHTAEDPIAITIDPRDEEHSLATALRRLAADHSLRDQLSRAAQAWWRQHATVERASAAWRAILDEAASLTPPPLPQGFPPHLTSDGTARAREILGEFAVHVDFL